MDDTTVDTDGRSEVLADLDFLLGRKTDMPAKRVEADRDVLQLARNVTGPAEANLADLREFHQAPGPIEPTELDVVALSPETVVDALLSRVRIVSGSPEKVLEGRVQIAKRLLLGGHRSFGDPLDLGPQCRQLPALGGKRNSKSGHAPELAVPVAPLLERDVVDQSADASIPSERYRLFGGRVELELVAKADFHTSSVTREFCRRKR